MQRILAILLPILLPFAARWVRLQEAKALETGRPLDPDEIENAKLMGVQHPERIRLLLVDEITGPTNFVLRKAADVMGFFGSHIGGITYRYGILLRRDCYPNRHLVAHECVHTSQYERLGGFNQFLRAYLHECLVIGYPAGPLEQEAISRSEQFS